MLAYDKRGTGKSTGKLRVRTSKRSALTLLQSFATRID